MDNAGMQQAFRFVAAAAAAAAAAVAAGMCVFWNGAE